MIKWTHLMLHHSLTEDTKTVSWDDIRNYHVITNGWNDIGYHWGIELVDRDYEVFVGRPINQVGAHCYQQGMNSKAIGIMFCGNFDLVAPPRPMLVKACKYIIKPMLEVFKIPRENIVGHRDYAPKSCPGKMFDFGTFFSILNQT